LKSQRKSKRKFKDKNIQVGEGVEEGPPELGNQQNETQLIKERLISLANFQISEIELEPNPSKFAIFYAIRSAVLEAKTKSLLFEAEKNSKLLIKHKITPCCLTCIGSCAVYNELDCPCHSVNSNKNNSARQESDVSDGCESEIEEEVAKVPTITKVPLLVGAGLRSLFELISEARQTQPVLCTKALHAFLDVIQGLQPEAFKAEPDDLINPLYDLLLDLSTLTALGQNAANHSNNWSAIACSALISLCIARGDTGQILKAISAILMSPKNISMQRILIPSVFSNLQKTVLCAALGRLDRPDFFTHGVPSNSLLLDVRTFSKITQYFYFYQIFYFS